MKHVHTICQRAAVAAALLVTACGSLPGIEAAPSSPLAQTSTAPSVAPSQSGAASPSASSVASSVPASLAAQPSASAATAGSATAQPSASASTVASSSASAAPSTAASAPAVASGDGQVLAVGGKGSISVLSKDGWTAPELAIEDTGRDDCYLMGGGAVFDDQGHGWFLCQGQTFMSNDGTTWAEPERDTAQAKLRFITRFFQDREKRMYVWSGEEMIRYAGGKAEVIGKPADFGRPTSPTLVSAAFLPNGSGYFTDTNDELYAYDGQTWKQLGPVNAFSDNESGSHVGLFATSKGELLGTRLTNVFKFDGQTFTPFIPASEFGKFFDHDYLVTGITRIAEAPDGKLWIGTDDYGLFVWDGSKLDLFDRSNGLPSSVVNDVQIDANGTVWVATAAGLAVRSGDTWTVALPSTSGLADSFIAALAVKGTPALPAPDAQSKTASLSGRISEDGKPVANKEVEICSDGGRSRGDGEDTPCGNQFFTQKTTTDDTGNYIFENVSLGTYSISYNSPKKDGWVFSSTLHIPVLNVGEAVTQDISSR